MSDSKKLMADASAPYVWVVAAGSGGHIFPGLNVVEELKKRNPKTKFLFFGDPARLEAKIIPSKGFRIAYLFSGRWKGSGFLSRIMALWAVAIGTLQALKKTFEQKPDFLFSVGGYVSVPVALACFVRRIPIYLMEPNIRSGMANRLLSRISKAVFTTPGSDAKAKMQAAVYEFGNPVRQDFKQAEIRSHVKRILVLGGSQGALSLCRASLEMMKDGDLQKSGMDLFLQSGEKNLEQAREWQSEFDVSPWTTVEPFINEMPAALSQADLVIARAGAMTVAELAMTGIPTIFVPFPFAADDHQRVNAKLLMDSGAARMVEENISGDPKNVSGYQKRLLDQVLELCVQEGHFEKRKQMNREFLKWSKPHAARDIVTQIEKELP